LLPALQIASPDAAAHLRFGIEALRAHQFDSAVEEFKKASEVDPAQPQSYVGLGQAYMQMGHYSDAVLALKHALEMNPDLQGAHQLLGYSLLTEGYAEEAIAHLEQANDRGVLGIAQLESNHFGDAVTNLQAALAAHPNDPDLLYYLSRASQMLANETSEKVIASFPQSPRAHQLKAQNYFALGDTAHSEAEYRAALSARPDLPGAHLELGEVYLHGSQLKPAENEFRAERKNRPGSGEAAYRLGQLLLREGKAREALEVLMQADELAPNMPETLNDLGQAALLAGNRALAEKSWMRLLAVESSGAMAARAHFGLAAVYRSDQKPQEAEREMTEYQRLSGTLEFPDGQQR
jgi:tetratricopeptide (TPR) repeat protein